MLIIDTAGRLQNKADLMAELAKIVRVLKKLDPSAPHSVVLVLDATTGQNALNQVQIFQEIAGVTSLVVTKLDGTARGGILVAIAERFGLPVNAIGVGEGVDDLQAFDAEDFARAIAGLDSQECSSSLKPSRRRRAESAPASGAALAAKLAIELGPLLVFFGANAAAGIYAATAVFMVATLIALGVAWWRYHKLPVMPLVSGAVVLVFGGLTLYLRDETFIKLKPTIVYLMFAVLLGAGLLLKKPVLELLLGPVFNLTERGLAQADAALGLLLHRHGGGQRAGLAQCLDRRLGELQGLRLPAAHLPVRPRPDAADAALQRADGAGTRRRASATSRTRAPKHGLKPTGSRLSCDRSCRAKLARTDMCADGYDFHQT